jgi:NADH dehydrogenase FAD-containing subunit
LEAAKRLGEGLARRRHVEVVLIEAQAQPADRALTYDVGVARLGAQLARRAPQELVGEHVRVLQARVEGLDLARREVFAGQTRVGFDYLLCAVGLEGAPWGWVDGRALDQGAGVLDLYRWEDVVSLGERVGAVLRGERGQEEGGRVFVVAGGGQSGVELAAELASALQDGLSAEARAHARVVLVERRGELLPGFGAALQAKALDALGRLGVEVRLGDQALGFDGREVGLANGGAIVAQHVVSACGASAPRWLREAGLPVGEGGWLWVEDDLEVVGQEGIYAAGSCARSAREEGMYEGSARAARQGKRAADNLLMAMVGASPDPWEPPLAQPVWVRLGRGEAAVALGGRAFSGSAAHGALRVLQSAKAPTPGARLGILAGRLGSRLLTR